MKNKVENNQDSEQLNITAVISSTSTLYSECCNEYPILRKKDNVEYYKCPYCEEVCEVEWYEDEFPDYCR